jgi:hypothetical protein
MLAIIFIVRLRGFVRIMYDMAPVAFLSQTPYLDLAPPSPRNADRG